MALRDAGEERPAGAHGDEDVLHHVLFEMSPSTSNAPAFKDAPTQVGRHAGLALDELQRVLILLADKVDGVRHCGERAESVTVNDHAELERESVRR